jgi:hypothetical protein
MGQGNPYWPRAQTIPVLFLSIRRYKIRSEGQFHESFPADFPSEIIIPLSLSQH